MRKLLLALLAALGFSLPAQAQQLYTQPELDALLAPIALYPDALLTQVLIASTYPEQVEAAAKLPRDAQPDESWDPNVKALLSFPEVLNRMAGSPQWTRDLGQAFLNQEPHVMDTVQGLRKRAQNNGQLQSNDQQTVYEAERAIVVEPRRPEVVYVPYYDPYVVYGGWWWPGYYPVVWRPWAVAPVFVSAGFFFARPVWAHRHVVVNHVHWRGHGHGHGQGHGSVHRPAPAFGGTVGTVRAHRPVDGKVVVRDYHRVPESRRQPIVQSGPRPQERNFQSRPEPRQSQNRPESRQSQNRPESRPQHAPAPRTSMPAAPRFSEARTQQAPRAAAPQPRAQTPQQSRAPMPQQSRAPAPQQPRAVAPQQPRFSAQQGGGRGSEMRGGGGGHGGGQRSQGGGGRNGGRG